MQTAGHLHPRSAPRSTSLTLNMNILVTVNWKEKSNLAYHSPTDTPSQSTRTRIPARRWYSEEHHHYVLCSTQTLRRRGVEEAVEEKGGRTRG